MSDIIHIGFELRKRTYATAPAIVKEDWAYMSNRLSEFMLDHPDKWHLLKKDLFVTFAVDNNQAPECIGCSHIPEVAVVAHARNPYDQRNPTDGIQFLNCRKCPDTGTMQFMCIRSQIELDDRDDKLRDAYVQFFEFFANNNGYNGEVDGVIAEVFPENSIEHAQGIYGFTDGFDFSFGPSPLAILDW